MFPLNVPPVLSHTTLVDAVGRPLSVGSHVTLHYNDGLREGTIVELHALKVGVVRGTYSITKSWAEGGRRDSLLDRLIHLKPSQYLPDQVALSAPYPDPSLISELDAAIEPMLKLNKPVKSTKRYMIVMTMPEFAPADPHVSILEIPGTDAVAIQHVIDWYVREVGSDTLTLSSATRAAWRSRGMSEMVWYLHLPGYTYPSLPKAIVTNSFHWSGSFRQSERLLSAKFLTEELGLDINQHVNVCMPLDQFNQLIQHCKPDFMLDMSIEYP